MAAKRKVPFGFFGTVFNVEADQASSSAAAKDAQMALMARSGVESLRVFFAWPAHRAAAGRLQLGPHGPGRRGGGAPSDLDPGERAGNPAMGLVSGRTPSTRPRFPPKRPDPLRPVPEDADRALRTEGLVLDGQPDHPEGPDPPVAALERADGPLVLGQQAMGQELREDAQGHLPDDPQGRPRRQGGGRLVRGGRGLHAVGGHPRPLQGRRQGLLRRHRGASVHERPEVGAATRSAACWRSSSACAR